MKRLFRLTNELITAMLFCLLLFTVPAMAAGVSYNNNAVLLSGSVYPGVYAVKAIPNADGMATIGIPSIAKGNLESNPTTESPAIIMGAAAPFERKIITENGEIQFVRTDGGTGDAGIYAPYSKFRYQILKEKAADGSVHQKISGFDGSYVIIRVDVSELVAGASSDSYLHVKQAGNAALQVLVPGIEGPEEAKTFADALGNQVFSYSLADGAAALKDKSGALSSTPYVDVILMSSGTLVAGADVGQTDPTKPQADFRLSFYVDRTQDYLPGWTYDPASYAPTDPNAPTLEAIMLAKYYCHDAEDQKIIDYLKEHYAEKGSYPAALPDAPVSSYKVMGSDLELEIIHGDDAGTGSYLNSGFKYWSLRKALNYERFNDTRIKLICEVPVLEGLLVDGTNFGSERKVIFDVNSFDIQIANHKETDAAGLTVRNASLTLMDGSNTTGAELAVGNNARMSIQEGGQLIIDVSCQLEVEYDAASIIAGEEEPLLNSGIISIESGGELVNNGVLTIEGTEGKPEDPQAQTQRDKKDAVLLVKEGGTLTNNGCLLSYGELYCMGTIVNNGAYDDVIVSNDPDKGMFTYHRGIQISWKDDVTQDSVYMGHLFVGEDAAKNLNPGALLKNSGDIVLVPGILECFGQLENSTGGTIYVCPVEEAIIPINPLTYDPLMREKRVKFGVPMKSYLDIQAGGTLQNAGLIQAASVEIVNNGRTGKLTPMEPGHRLFGNLALNVLGKAENSGTILLDGVYVFEEMVNTGSVGTRVVVSSNDTQTGILYDQAAAKLSEVYNASLTVDGSTNIWKYGRCTELTVSPTTQEGKGGTSPVWTIHGTSSTGAPGIVFQVNIYMLSEPDPSRVVEIEADKDIKITGPILPELNGNVVFDFRVVDGTGMVHDTATVIVTSEHETPPSAIGNLVYNGKEQTLISTGGGTAGTHEYRLGTDGEWSDSVPTAMNAGNYSVYYRLKGTEEAEGPVEVVIAQRPVTVSAVDLSSQVEKPLKELEYTVSNAVEGDTVGDISISTNALESVKGTYSISVSVTDIHPNYDVTYHDGTYTVTEGFLEVTAKDKYGVFSDELTYTGFNIDLMATPSTATPYYNFENVELTPENYKEKGLDPTLLDDLPAKAGEHIVTYYVDGGTEAISGSKRVIIEKAQQKAPEKLLTHEETSKDSGDGYIEGFVPREMEYRRADNDGTYKTAYYEREYVLPGTYLVRRIGDENHYPSPDTILTVPDGSLITVGFYLNPDDETPYYAVEGLKAGDLVPKPSDPVREGHTFLGWMNGEIPFNFQRPVTMSISLIALWDDSPAHVHSLTLVGAKEASCTEYGNTAYYECSICSHWFEDATALIEIKDRSSVLTEPLGHKWDNGKVTKQPTYTAEGIRTYTCRRDESHTKTEAIPRRKRESSGGTVSHSGAWTYTSSGWYYRENGVSVKNDWRLLDYNGRRYWYYFGETGIMKTGWLEWNGSRFYLVPLSDGWMGRMVTGWQKIDGKWYYFEPTAGKNQGHLYRSEKTPDGYRVGPDGVWDGKPAETGR